MNILCALFSFENTQIHFLDLESQIFIAHKKVGHHVVDFPLLLKIMKLTQLFEEYSPLPIGVPHVIGYDI